MRWVSGCRELMSTGTTVGRRPLGTGGRVSRRDRRGSFSSPRRWWREEESEVEALRRKVPVSACAHGGGPPGLFYTCSEAAWANNAENLFFLLAQRPTLGSVWHFNRKFTCSSDARSVMSAAVDRPGQSWTVPDSPGRSACAPRSQRKVFDFDGRTKNSKYSWCNDKLRGQSEVRTGFYMSFMYFLADSEGHQHCWLHASIFLNNNLSLWWLWRHFITLSLSGGKQRLCSCIVRMLSRLFFGLNFF